MDIKLINKEEIKIKTAFAKDINCKIQNNQIVLKNHNEINYPIILQIELENNAFITSFELLCEKNEQPIDKVKVFVNSHLDEWENIPILESYKKENRIFYQLPLIQNKNIQIILVPEYGIKKDNEYKVVLLNNINTQLKATSTGDRLWVVENLIDQRKDYGWASQVYETNTQESIEVDLNGFYYLSAIALKSINEDQNCFPIKFTISISEDQISWITVASESDFYVARNNWYKWDYSIRKARYLRINILEHYPVAKKIFCSKLLELEVYTIPENIFNSLRNRYLSQTVASELIPGSVKLAENKSTRPGVVIQGNDSRLRNSTTEYPGIVQLAKDGESRASMVVQGNDLRLKKATVNNFGICRLAKDGEKQDGVVIQGNDSRLRGSTTEYPGIVQLAKDGESRVGVVVQGNDLRLKNATVNNFGICRLAKDGEKQDGVVIQGNDSRLRGSTTEYPGIVQLAKHNEKIQGRALQADDPRLKEGNLQEKGRVQFAQDGEDSELKAVQGSDKRLRTATINDFGIVRLANAGVKVKGAVVQSDDPRLYDSRKPLEHSHNYAEKNHSLNSHTGSLHINLSEKTENLDPSFYSNTTKFPLAVKNASGVAAGFSGGIFVYSDINPSIVTGSSSETAILAFSKSRAAGEFISENDYAINLPNKSGPIKGSKKSLRSEGLVSILGGIEIAGETAFVVKWRKFLSEAFSHGDLLTIDGSEQVQKIKSNKHNLIGVYVKDPKFVLQVENSNEPGIYIAVSGIVQIKVRGQVSAGESIGFINADPGVAQKTTKNHAMGTALETSNDNGDKLVWCVIKN